MRVSFANPRNPDVQPPPPSSPATHAAVEQDAVESIVPLMPLVLPLVGGVLMLLLASIAVYMA